MNDKKKKLISKTMKDFKNYDGGSEFNSSIKTFDPEVLKKGLQSSFDQIFPDLVAKRAKLRKHVMFDQDIFETFDGLSKSCETPFSALINSALRNFVQERFSEASLSTDPVAELLRIRERERELIDQITELDLSDELASKLG